MGLVPPEGAHALTPPVDETQTAPDRLRAPELRVVGIRLGQRGGKRLGSARHSSAHGVTNGRLPTRQGHGRRHRGRPRVEGLGFRVWWLRNHPG